MLPVKKIYVDSKYKVADGDPRTSDSNFKFQLQQTCYMPENTKFFISDVCIPHTWETVNDFNSKLYLRTFVVHGQNAGLQRDYVITLDKKSYIGNTFAAMLKSKIQTETGETGIHCAFNNTTNKLSLYIGSPNGTEYWDLQCHFLTDKELRNPDHFTGFAWAPANPNHTYDINNLKSANTLISNTSGEIFTDPFTFAEPFNNHLNLQPIRNIYIHSPNLGNFQTLGPRGEQTIIKKVPVSSNQGEMIFQDYTPGAVDMLDCSNQTLRQLEFRLTNVDGIEIPLNSNHVSFSIVFN